MKRFLSLFFVGLLAVPASTFAIEHETAFKKLVKLYKSAEESAEFSDFKAREQVWAGACVHFMQIAGEDHYFRSESYLPVIRQKALPGEAPSVRFGDIGVGDNPYSSITIETPAQALWYLRGDASNNISLAKQSKKSNALIATSYETNTLSLRRSSGGRSGFYYLNTTKGGTIVNACFFDEQVL